MGTLSQQLERVALALCEAAATPRALTVSLLIRHREYKQLFNLKLDPCYHHVYLRPEVVPRWHFKGLPVAARERVYWDYQVTEFLRKLELDIGGDLVSECWEAFCEDEQTNARTNVRFQRLLGLSGLLDVKDEPQLRFLEAVQKRVRWILGRPPVGLNEARFGKGGTFDDRGGFTTIPDKMTARPTVYATTRDFLPFWYESAWGRSLVKAYPWKSDPKLVRGNRFGTVPKDALRRRGIASEASVSGFYQLSLGRSMRAAVRSSTGIDLGSAQLIHRRLVKLASRNGKFASIDLSSASNLNAKWAIRAFLQRAPGWLELLEALRAPLTLSPQGRGNARWRYLEMFSSMGNGFTFELETVIFLAICLAAGDMEGRDLEPGVDVFVYGDDILVPIDMAQKVIMYLEWAGHKPNPRKTFTSGSFRESCGADYFDGVAVRPHYQTADPQEPNNWFSLANGLRRAAKQDGASPERWTRMRAVWRKCVDNLPVTLRGLKGPESLGDIVIHDDRGWWLREKPGHPYIYEVKSLVPCRYVVGWEHWHAEIVCAAALYGCRTEGVTPRRNGEEQILGYHISWTNCIEAVPGVTGFIT